MGIIALRSNPHLALPQGPAPAQECLERERFPLKITLRVIATQLSLGLTVYFILCESALPPVHAALLGDVSLPGTCLAGRLP